MSRTFSINCGSVDSLNVSVRCGCRPNAFQMRCTALAGHARRRRHRADTPVRRIARRGLQRLDDHRLDLVVGDAPRCATARLVQQTRRHLQPQTAIATCQPSCWSTAARAQPGCWSSRHCNATRSPHALPTHGRSCDAWSSVPTSLGPRLSTSTPPTDDHAASDSPSLYPPPHQIKRPTPTGTTSGRPPCSCRVWIKETELAASLGNREVPLDRWSFHVSLALPGRDLAACVVAVSEALGQALAGQYRQFALGDVEPAAVLGRVVELQLPGDPTRLAGGNAMYSEAFVCTFRLSNTTRTTCASG